MKSPEDGAPGVVVEVDRTERHLARVREMIREARERFFPEPDAGPGDVPPNPAKDER